MVHIRYDNRKAAVSRVLFGRNRTESARLVAFRSHHATTHLDGLRRSLASYFDLKNSLG